MKVSAPLRQYLLGGNEQYSSGKIAQHTMLLLDGIYFDVHA